MTTNDLVGLFIGTAIGSFFGVLIGNWIIRKLSGKESRGNRR